MRGWSRMIEVDEKIYLCRGFALRQLGDVPLSSQTSLPKTVRTSFFASFSFLFLLIAKLGCWGSLLG